VRTFEESRKTCDTMKMIVLISLLGNYTHSDAGSRPPDEVRALLYHKLLDHKDDPVNHEWFKQLVLQCPYLVEFCVRDHLVFHFNEDQALSKHVNQLFDLEKFITVTKKTTQMIRKRFAVHIQTKTLWSVMLKDMSTALQPFHTALLALCYRLPKSRASISAILTSLRSKVPLTPLGKMECIQVKDEYEDDDNDEEEQTEDQVVREIEESLGAMTVLQEVGADKSLLTKEVTASTVTPSSSIQSNTSTTTSSNGGPEAKVALSVISKAPLLLGADAYRELNRIIKIVAPTRRDCLVQIISLFPLMGVKFRSVHKIQFILEELRIGSLNEDAVPNLMMEIKEEDALAYNMLQVSIDLIKLHTRVQVISRLPVHVIKGQLLAQQASFNCLVGTKYAIYDNPEFVYCSVCNAKYSMTRQFNSSYKKVYMHGLRDAVVDYETDFVYCWRGKKNALGACSEVPLVRISLIGVLIRHDGEDIQLCGTCGLSMVLDTKLCSYNDNGAMCSKCTEAHGCPEVLERQRFDALDAQIRICVICVNPLKKSSSAYYYAEDVYLCSNHHSRYMLNQMRAKAVSKGSALTPDETRLQLIELHKQHMKERAEGRKASDKRQLARAKLNRNKRR